MSRKLKTLTFFVFISILTLAYLFLKFPEVFLLVNLNIKQEALYYKVPFLVQEIIQNPYTDSKIKNYLSNCKFFKLNNNKKNYDFGDSRCIFLIAGGKSSNFLVATVDNSYAEGGYWLSYALLFPYDLSDETWKRVIYHEAIHMVDFIERPECLKSPLGCRIKDEYHAYSKTSDLFKEYMVQNGFTVEQLMQVKTESKTDPVVTFIRENSVSEDDFILSVQELDLLKRHLNGTLYSYLKEFYTLSYSYD